MIEETESNLPNPGTTEKWIEALENFKNIIYPNIFKDFGFTLPEAYVVWLMNTTKNAIYDLEAAMNNDDKQEF